MARPKSSGSSKESEVARLITEICNSGDKPQNQIAEEAGFDPTSNIITMLKTGRTKFPLKRVQSFSKATSTDPEILLDAILREYMPEVHEVLTGLKGRVISKDERELLQRLREAKREHDSAKGRTTWKLSDIGKVKEWAQRTVQTFTA